MSSHRSRAELSGGRTDLPTDAEGFGRRLEEHRRDLVVLCYRFLGSPADAEDAAQETALRAWRSRDTYRGEASLRTWLHRIATRVCLDMLERRSRRRLPTQLSGPADPGQPPAPPSSEVSWLEPLPDRGLQDAALDPAARYSMRESVALAFVAALQTLPPRQRAVLLLRDVLAWPATEVADALAMTVSAANSALHRARTTLQSSVHPEGAESPSARRPADPEEQRLLEAYIRAWESDDVDALVATLREEVRLAMPPSPAWYAGRAAVAELLRRWVLPMGPFRLRSAQANLQPATVLSVVGPDGSSQAVGVHVLTVRSGEISHIDAFMDPRIAGHF